MLYLQGSKLMEIKGNLINISVALWIVRQNFGIFLIRNLEILGHLQGQFEK